MTRCMGRAPHGVSLHVMPARQVHVHAWRGACLAIASRACIHAGVRALQTLACQRMLPFWTDFQGDEK